MEALLKREIVVNKAACRAIGVFVFIILTALGAFVRIPLPFTPVPVTLQTFFVLLSAAFLGAGLGALTQASYALLGLLGISVFAGAGTGALYFFGPTGGYIFGFIVSSVFLGRAVSISRANMAGLFFLFCLADSFILLSGAMWLKCSFGFSFLKSLYIGFLPFIPGDLIKAFIASWLFIKIRPRLRQIF